MNVLTVVLRRPVLRRQGTLMAMHTAPQIQSSTPVSDARHLELETQVIAQMVRIRAFLSKVYSVDGETPRTCYGATIFGRFAAEAA
jgi:hypothetical protein